MSLLDHHTNIGIDIDETLASAFSPGLEFFHSAGYLLNIEKFEDITEGIFSAIPGANIDPDMNDTLWNQFEGSDIVHAPLVPHAREGITFLQNHGKNLTLITGRSSRSPNKEQTYAWIEKFFPEMIEKNPIYFTNNLIRKSQLCKELGITLLIDDVIENAIDVTSNGITCILLERPWNREKVFTHPLLIRVKDWTEALEVLTR